MNSKELRAALEERRDAFITKHRLDEVIGDCDHYYGLGFNALLDIVVSQHEALSKIKECIEGMSNRSGGYYGCECKQEITEEIEGFTYKDAEGKYQCKNLFVAITQTEKFALGEVSDGLLVEVEI